LLPATAVKFDGDDNQYLVVAATSTITIGAPGLRQDLADQAAVTVLSEFTANMAFDRNAFLLASRTPAMPEGGDTADDVMNVTDPVSGITFQVALYRQYRQVRYEVGLAWGVAPSARAFRHHHGLTTGASAPLFFRRPNGRINQRARAA
jgi:hypothetical protein